MKIVFATDHAGFALKEALVPFVRNLGYEVEDFGAHEFDGEDDYPIFIRKAAQAVANDPSGTRGIILGGSGQGEAMCANRTRGVRAVVFYGGPKEIITLSREHNDANILSLGARFLDESSAKEAVELWLLTTHPEAGKHDRRNAMLDS